MIFLAVLLIIVAVAFVVAYPLWRGGPRSPAVAANPVDDLLAQKETTYAALKELEFDYALGNLTPQDHSELERKYKDKAVTILKQLDARDKGQRKRRPPEEQIEAEILQMRRTAREARPKGGVAEAETPRLRPSPGATGEAQEICPHCQSKVAAGARYCPYCGSSLIPLVCPQCSAPYRRGDRFCSRCGAPLAEEKKT